MLDPTVPSSMHGPLRLFVSDVLRGVNYFIVPGGVVMTHANYQQMVFIPMQGAEGWLRASGFYELNITKPPAAGQEFPRA